MTNEICSAVVELVKRGESPLYAIKVYNSDKQAILTVTARDAYDPTLRKLVREYRIGTVRHVDGSLEFYDVAATPAVTVEVESDPYADNPLVDSEFELTYRSDARIVLGNRPVDTWEDLLEIINDSQYIIACPVYAYVHGVVRFRLGKDWRDGSLSQGHAEFDSGLSGYMLARKSEICKWWGVEQVTVEVMERVKGAMTRTLKAYEAWLNDDCWTVSIRDGDDLVDFTTAYGSEDTEQAILTACATYNVDRKCVIES